MASSKLDQLRQQVREAVEAAPAAASLSAEKRNELARNLVKIFGAMTEDQPIATALEEPPAQPVPAAPEKTSITGNAVNKATEAFGALVDTVDFPKFVSGLIEGVFTSIVDSSIRQMEAYGELVAAVAKSVDQFARENYTEDDARQHLMDAFPQAIERTSGDGNGTRIKLRDDLDDAQKPDLAGFLNLQEVNLDDEDGEKVVVAAARRKMAEGRQKQLATMVLMGINRIVVTDGKINAKVMFEVKARETADYAAQAQKTQNDSTTDVKYEHESSRSLWGTSRASRGSSNVSTKVSTGDATSSQKNHEEIQTRAQLSGEVTVNFKSETFPLEKIASMDQMGAIQSRGSGPSGSR